MGKIKSNNYNQKSNSSPLISDIEKILRSLGRPFDKKTQIKMKSRFGHDFNRVWIHTDQKAVESAEANIDAAYTLGDETVFGKGQHAPDLMRGRALLAHKLTHVVQQQSASPLFSESLEEMTPRNDPSEREADRVSKVVATSGQPNLWTEQLIGMRKEGASVPEYLYSLISGGKEYPNIVQNSTDGFDGDLLVTSLENRMKED